MSPRVAVITDIHGNQPRTRAVTTSSLQLEPLLLVPKESLGALDLELDESDLTATGQAVPADATAGARYPEQAMAQLDSER